MHGAEHTIQREVDLDILRVGARAFLQNAKGFFHFSGTCRAEAPKARRRVEQCEREVAMQRRNSRAGWSDLLPLRDRRLHKSAREVQRTEQKAGSLVVTLRFQGGAEHVVGRSPVWEDI